jgi:hypothetical protein
MDKKNYYRVYVSKKKNSIKKTAMIFSMPLPTVKTQGLWYKEWRCFRIKFAKRRLTALCNAKYFTIPVRT